MTNRLEYPKSRLMVNNGNNILGSSTLHPIHINKDVPLDFIKNYKAVKKTNKVAGIGTFGRLGFKDDTKGDPNFNPHFEYNQRRVSILF